MSFRRQQDREGGATSRSFDIFAGRHGAYTKSAAPNEYAEICDFNLRDHKLVRRHGKRKTATAGQSGDTQWIGSVRFAKGQRYLMYQQGSLLLAELM